MRRVLQPSLCLLMVAGLLTAQRASPERKVYGRVIISNRDPRVRIEVSKSVQYVGADRWILYGMAHCELHAFAEADANKSIHRLYWVQFEGYIPSRPELHHTYDSPRHGNIGGLDFYVDTWVRSKEEKIDAGSDREHIEALIREKNYKMPDGMAYVRFVHLLDAQKRKELMIIYGEDLALWGVSAQDLKEGGKAHERWPTIEKALIEHGRNQIQIRQLAR